MADVPDIPDNRPIELDSAAELDDLVDERSVVLIEFYTNGCGICRQMEPVVRLLAGVTGLTVGTINPRADPPLIDRFDVRSVPLLVVFEAGEPIARRAEGFLGADAALAWIADETDGAIEAEAIV